MASPSPARTLLAVTGVLLLIFNTLELEAVITSTSSYANLSGSSQLPIASPEQEKGLCHSLKRLGHYSRQRSHLFKMGASLTLCEGTASLIQKQPSHTPLYTSIQTAPSDIEALTALYNATNGKGWTHSTNWLQGDPCGNKWHGITCNPEGRVIYILLYTNNLNGRIPPEIAKASQLVQLDISVNHLIGEIPVEIYGMKYLEQLILESNYLTGHLPTKLSMPNLTILEVFFNQLTGPLPVVWDTPKLVNLDLGHNQFSGPLPEAIGNLSNMQELYIDYTEGINGTVPESYGNLLHLTDISLAADNLTNFAIPQSWAKFSDLKYLQISNLIGELPAWIGESWPKMEILLMFDSNFSGGMPDSIGKLSSLLSLDIYSAGLSGTVPASFSGLVKTTELNLSGNRLSMIPASLLKTLFMHIPRYFCQLGSNPWSCSIDKLLLDYCEASCSECNTGERHSNQTLCLEHKGCGWCYNGPNCLEGNATGPTSFKCSDWKFG